MGTLFSTVHYTLHKMKFLPVILFVFLVIAGYHASSLDSLKNVNGVQVICGKQCEKINKMFKKKFEKVCPKQVCEDEKKKDKIFKKHGCEEPCVKTFAGEEEHDHDHENEEGNGENGAGLLTGSVLTILIAQFL